MEGSVCLVLVLLTIGLCLETYRVNANPVHVQVHVFGKSTGENMTEMMEELHAQKRRLEAELTKVLQPMTRIRVKQDLKTVIAWIENLEKTTRVPYKDHKKVVQGQQKDFDKKKEKLRMQLDNAEHARHQALEVIGKMKEIDQAKIESYKKKVEDLTAKKSEIVATYAAVTEKQYQQIETMNKKIKKVLEEREEMKKKLDKAQDLHAQALEAMATATQEGYKPISIPYQNEIEELRADINGNQGLSLQGTDPIYGLLSTQTKLRALLDKLYTEGEIPSDAAHKEMENELAQIESEAVRVRDQHDNQRNNILESLKNKGFTGYDENEIASLQTANQQVKETMAGLQEIARRSAYLKAISQVNDMLDECSNEIQGAIVRYAETLNTDQQQLDNNEEGPSNSHEEPQKEDEELFEDPETIYDTIHQKYLLYKDLNELYRTKLSTAIVTGLAKLNKRVPIPFPGCSTLRLLQIRDKVGEWADGVQYALRLTKSLNKDGNKSMIARFFVKFLKNIQNAFLKLLGRKIPEETTLEDDNSMTTSMEIFENQENIDIERHFEYINTNLDVLDADTDIKEEKLGLFRYNFIVLKEVPEVIQERALDMFQELADDPSETNKAKLSVKFGELLDEMEAAERRLRKLFTTLMFEVKSSFSQKGRQYQESLEEYKRCRHNTYTSIFDSLALAQ